MSLPITRSRPNSRVDGSLESGAAMEMRTGQEAYTSLSLEQLNIRYQHLRDELAEKTVENRTLKSQMRKMEEQTHSVTTTAAETSITSQQQQQIKKLHKQVTLQQKIIAELMMRQTKVENGAGAKDGNGFRSLKDWKRKVKKIGSRKKQGQQQLQRPEDFTLRKSNTRTAVKQDTAGFDADSNHAAALDRILLASTSSSVKRDFVRDCMAQEGDCCWDILTELSSRHAQVVFRMEQLKPNGMVRRWRVATAHVNVLKKRKKRKSKRSDKDAEASSRKAKGVAGEKDSSCLSRSAAPPDSITMSNKDDEVSTLQGSSLLLSLADDPEPEGFKAASGGNVAAEVDEWQQSTAMRNMSDFEQARQELMKLEKQVKIQAQVNSYLTKVSTMVQQAPEDSLQIPGSSWEPSESLPGDDRFEHTVSSSLVSEDRESAQLAYEYAVQSIQGFVEPPPDSDPSRAEFTPIQTDSDDESSLSSGSNRRARRSRSSHRARNESSSKA